MSHGAKFTQATIRPPIARYIRDRCLDIYG
jgi:hypothetical protein